jgi:hypothetical protein
MDDQKAKEFESFVSDLQSIVAERVDELRTRQSARPPRSFLDSEKVILVWPELSGLIIEELR